MALALCSSARPPCHAKPAAKRSSRVLAVAVRASSKEAELAKMQEFKAGLARNLEAVKRPGATASAVGSGEAATAAADAAPAAAAPAPPAVAEGGKALREVKKEDYYEAIKEAGNKLVVVDCFTDWCGPCKMIMPTLQQWAVELEDKVEIVKFNCNKHNKDLGIELGIKVAPTFLIYKNGEQVDKMTGAKTEQLRELIEKYM